MVLRNMEIPVHIKQLKLIKKIMVYRNMEIPVHIKPASPHKTF